MLIFSLIILISCKALSISLFKETLSPYFFYRLSAIILLFSSGLVLNFYKLSEITTGLGIYSGLFQVTKITQIIESFLLIISSLILLSWPIQQNILLNESKYKTFKIYLNKIGIKKC